MKRKIKLTKNSEHYKRVKQAETELNKRIKEDFSQDEGKLRDLIKSSIASLKFSLGLVFELALVLLIVIAPPLCQIFGIMAGISIIWSNISLILSKQLSSVYIIGFSKPLFLFEFNPGLGNFCIGLGIVRLTSRFWAKLKKDQIYYIISFMFGLASIVLGLTNLLGFQVDFVIRVSELPGIFLSILIGATIVLSLSKVLLSFNLRDVI